MAFYVKTGDFLDEFSDAGFLKSRQHWQHLDDSAEEAEAFRKHAEIHAVITNLGRVLGGDGEIKHIASIDKKLGMFMLGLNPDFFTDKAKFHAWLRKHREWKVA